MLGLQQLWSDTKFIHIRRLKAYIVLTFFDSFRNKSRKPQPIRTKVGTVHMPRSRADNVHEILGAISKVGAKWGAKKCPGRVIFCQQYHTTFRQLHNGRFSLNLATTRESWVKRRIRTEIYEKVSIQGSFAPKTRNFEGVKQVPHSEQATDQGIHCREILFIPRCSPRAREFPISANFSVRPTVAELRPTGLESCPIFGFWPIFPMQNP